MRGDAVYEVCSLRLPTRWGIGCHRLAMVAIGAAWSLACWVHIPTAIGLARAYDNLINQISVGPGGPSSLAHRDHRVIFSLPRVLPRPSVPLPTE